MAVSTETQELLQLLADKIIRSASGTTQPRFTQQGDRKSPGQDILDESRKNSKVLQTVNKDLKTYISGLYKGINTKELEKLPDEMRKSLDSVGTKSAKKMSKSIKSIGDVVKVKQQIQSQESLVETLKDYKNGTGASLADVEEAAKKAGIPLNKLVTPVTKAVKNIDGLATETEELSTAFKSAAGNTTKQSTRVSISSALFTQHSAKMKESIRLLVEETRTARERGAWDAKYIDALFKMGVSMKVWTEVLGDNRATQQAMSAGGRDFTAEMKSGSDQLVKYSKDNEQALKTTALFAKNLSGMGVSQNKLTGSLDEQIAMYRDNYRIFGVTAESFGKSTEALLADTDIRHSLALMAEKERKQYILGIQAQEANSLAIGYTTEQARELTKVFASLGAESPKERMKKAAKIRALAGALGLGAEGAELQQIMLNINQLTGDAKADAITRGIELQQIISNRIKEEQGSGRGRELVVSQLVEMAGFGESVKRFETLSLKGKKRDTEEAKATAPGREVPEILNTALGIWDGISAFQATSIGLLTSILATLVAQTLGKGLGGIGKGGALAAAKTTAKFATKAFAPLAVVLAGVSKYMEVADRKDLSGGQKAVQVGSTAAGAGLGAIGGAAAGAALGTLIFPGIGTIIGAAVGGIVGGIGGTGLGEIVGEGISGLMSSPETTQTAIDAVESKKLEEKTLTDPTSTGKSSSGTQAVSNEMLDKTFKTFTTTLNMFHEQNSELLSTVQNSTELGREQLRVTGVNRQRAG